MARGQLLCKASFHKVDLSGSAYSGNMQAICCPSCIRNSRNICLNVSIFLSLYDLQWLVLRVCSAVNVSTRNALNHCCHCKVTSSEGDNREQFQGPTQEGILGLLRINRLIIIDVASLQSLGRLCTLGFFFFFCSLNYDSS